jgi:hypothetical protein
MKRMKRKRLKKSIWDTVICLTLTQLITGTRTRTRSYRHNDDRFEEDIEMRPRMSNQDEENRPGKGARIVGSRFQYKIKRHHAGDNRLKVKRLKTRLVF